MKNRRVVAVENIPRSLQERSQWVCWKYFPRPNGKPTKLPFKAMKGGQAKSNDPNTWTTFNKALDAFKRDTTYAGIGYVFFENDPYTCIDLDDCLDEQGEFIWGKEIVDRIDTYCEVSPSGNGVKMIIEGIKTAWAATLSKRPTSAPSPRRLIGTSNGKCGGNSETLRMLTRRSDSLGSGSVVRKQTAF